MSNLIIPGEFYYHPLTRKSPIPHHAYIDSNGNEFEEYSSDKLEFVSSLTEEEIVRYYYQSCNVRIVHQNLSRDVGSVKYLVNKLGLDGTLFCIEALISQYLDGDERESYAPPLIKAGELSHHAADRIGQVKLITQQFELNV